MKNKSALSIIPANKKGYGLCLSGGGAKGAYQIGCWRAFLELGLDFEAVAGSSVGALNGAFICQGDYERAEHFWSHVSSEQVLRLDGRQLHRLAARAVTELAILALPLPFKATRAVRYLRYGMTMLSLLSNKGSLRQLMRNGLFDAGGLEQTIDKYLDVDRLMASDKTLIISTLQFTRMDSLLRGRTQYHRIDSMKADDIKRLLLASASIPILFPAVEMDGLYHRDGAVRVKIPVRPLYDLGVRNIIAVHLKGRRRVPHWRFREASIVDIAPGYSLGRPVWSTLNFTPDAARVCLDMGYKDAMEVLRHNVPA